MRFLASHIIIFYLYPNVLYAILKFIQIYAIQEVIIILFYMTNFIFSSFKIV